MGYGLKEFKERQAQKELEREQRQKPRVQRFALQKDGDSAVVRFAQEMDVDAKNYTEEAGIGFVNIEHTNGSDPKNGWKNRATCSMEEEGACFPCEKVSDHAVDWNARKGWKQKEKFYINVIAGEPREVVETSNGQEKKRYFTTDLPEDAKGGTVYVLEQGTYNGIYEQLANFFLNARASKETILGKTFQITRSGSGFNDTKYNVIPVEDLPKDATPLSDFELVDLNEVIEKVPYAQQQAFYYRGVSVADAQPEAAATGGSTSTGTEDAW